MRLRRLVVLCGRGRRLALSRGVRGAYKCRRCWVFAIFEIVLAPRRCGGGGVVSVALATTSELAEVSRRNNLRPFAEKSV